MGSLRNSECEKHNVAASFFWSGHFPASTLFPLVQTGYFLFKLFLDGLIFLDDLIVKHVPELPAIDGSGSHVEEIENGQANQNPSPPWQSSAECPQLLAGTCPGGPPCLAGSGGTI
jgi:hypothetical protein